MRVVSALFLFIVSQPVLGPTATSISGAAEYPNEGSSMKKPHRLTTMRLAVISRGARI